MKRIVYLIPTGAITHLAREEAAGFKESLKTNNLAITGDPDVEYRVTDIPHSSTLNTRNRQSHFRILWKQKILPKMNQMRLYFRIGI